MSKAQRAPQFGLTLTLMCVWCIGVTGCRHAPERPTSNSSPTIQFVPLPTPTPVALDAKNVDKFVDWVSTMPATQRPNVRREIAQVAGNAAVIDAVVSKLSLRGPLDFGRQLIYLSVLGETRNEAAVAPLRNYVYSPDCQVNEQLPAAQTETQSLNLTSFDACASLKAWAVGMVANINTPAARTVTLQAIGDHPSRVVRLSAINAFLYANGDSAGAAEQARRAARPNEAKLVGLPRLAPDFSLREFDARVARYYQEHPEDRPGPVQQGGRQ
jgi:hypothetical protein